MYHFKSYLRKHNVWAISLIVLIVAAIVFFPVNAASQSCDYLPEDQGGERFIEINGETYFYTTEDKGRQMIKDLKTCRLDQKKLDLLEEKLTIKDEQLRIQSNMIQDLQDYIEFEEALPEPEPPTFFEKHGFVLGFGSGVVATAAVTVTAIILIRKNGNTINVNP